MCICRGNSKFLQAHTVGIAPRHILAIMSRRTKREKFALFPWQSGFLKHKSGPTPNPSPSADGEGSRDLVRDGGLRGRRPLGAVSTARVPGAVSFARVWCGFNRPRPRRGFIRPCLVRFQPPASPARFHSPVFGAVSTARVPGAVSFARVPGAVSTARRPARSALWYARMRRPTRCLARMYSPARAISTAGSPLGWGYARWPRARRAVAAAACAQASWSARCLRSGTMARASPMWPSASAAAARTRGCLSSSSLISGLRA
jgi:hypothetical protein